jgi:cation diffusion facilitator family transporter
MATGVNPAKRRAAALSVASNTVLVAGKLVVGIVTGSVAVISEAIHSGMDLLAALIAFVAVSYSDRPPDREHAHGHGKIENLSGAIEALLIFGAIAVIAYEAVGKLVRGVTVEHVYLGAIVMGASAVINTFVSLYLQRVGRRTESEALLADAAHLRTDVYTSLGVFAGLLAVHFTGITWLDPAAALAVALLIGWEAWQITRRSVGGLLDVAIPEEEEHRVREAIEAAGVTYHALRTRKAGATRTIDLHLDVSPTATVEQVHELCDRIERDVQQALPTAQVFIHPEPDLEADATLPLKEWVERILEQHRSLHRGYAELHSFDVAEAVHFAVRIDLHPGTTIAEADELFRHLAAHIEQHVPGAHVYFHPRPAPIEVEGPEPRAREGQADPEVRGSSRS